MLFEKNMNRINIYLSIFISILSWSFTQSFHIKPYLQNATPTSITIMWETTSYSESIVEWGETEDLGNSTLGTAEVGFLFSYIHTVQISDLTPNAIYHYRTVTEGLTSEIYHFKTPQLVNDEHSTRLVAMSDMQKDWSHWDKFEEIVHDGILSYMHDNFQDDLVNELDVVLIPGDLVSNGHDYYHWSDHFFTPSEGLFSHIPLYPVLGNHENDTEYFTMYFDLPHNATPGYDEHWWWFDLSNVRIIGLDSNWGYQIDEQLEWLESLLDQSCFEDHIDFVFAQLHHPHHSELWIDGNTDYTGMIIDRLEQFSTTCAKPSIHFFGHTHGYSRGQSQEHQHVMVNVASAGGAIDNWGEFAQFDYPEYLVSQDEWGFVVVDIDAGDNPKFTIKRISRGNEYIPRDNELRDELTIKLWNTPPETPTTPNFSIGETVIPDMLTLSASPFYDSDGDEHGHSHWQLYENCDFSQVIIDEFESHENWYFDVDTQAGNDLTTFEVTFLNEHTNYCYRVRYRDKGLVWSDWSETTSFTTGESAFSENLLINGDAEDGTNSWIIDEGIFESLVALECAGVEPFEGERYFSVGGLCESNDYAEVHQDVNVDSYFDCINNGHTSVYFSGQLSNWGGSDIPEMHLQYVDVNGNIISISELLTTATSSWTHLGFTEIIPENTNIVRAILTGTRHSGTDNDSYFDDIRLNIWTSPQCNIILGDLNNDASINILDVVQLVNIILNTTVPNEHQLIAGDINEDGIFNVLDVVQLVNIILGR